LNIFCSINFLFSLIKNSFLEIVSISESSFDIRSLEDKEESSILLAALICGPKTKPISLAKGS